jgi:hypothetical protein
MVLDRRELPFDVPSYSLTGDILSFQRCALQYRYYNGSSLPPSRPVQMWTGEFVHGVLEEAYRYWLAHHPPFPWPSNPTPWPNPGTLRVRANHDIGVLGDLVEARLIAGGKTPRSQAARDLAYRRVEAAVNILGPYLFPLITAAERRIQGTRAMPTLPSGSNPARGGADRYELTGVVDVISHIAANANPGNPFVQAVQRIASTHQPPFEIIVDYKAERRPPTTDPRRQQHEWQVQTYAWLCTQVPQATPVGAALLLYLNELVPSQRDLRELKQEISDGTTDVTPANGSADYYALHRWQPAAGGRLPQLTTAFRIRRAMRVIDVSPQQVGDALGRIDQVVRDIEQSAMNENNTGDILSNWRACGTDRDCVACDFRHFCRSSAHRRHTPGVCMTAPVAPG